MSLSDRIAEIPGGDGWWRSGGQEVYEGLADALIAHGFTEDEAVDLLASAFSSAAAEFGD